MTYCEAKVEAEAERFLSDATGKGKRRADLIWLAGYGSSKNLALGGEDLGSGDEMKDETQYIDTTDFAEGRIDIRLQDYISPNGDLVNDSCSNGKGREANPDNLANTEANILPKGVKMTSSDRPMYVRDIYLNDEGGLMLKFDVDSLYTLRGRMEN